MREIDWEGKAAGSVVTRSGGRAGRMAPGGASVARRAGGMAPAGGAAASAGGMAPGGAASRAGRRRAGGADVGRPGGAAAREGWMAPGRAASRAGGRRMGRRRRGGGGGRRWTCRSRFALAHMQRCEIRVGRAEYEHTGCLNSNKILHFSYPAIQTTGRSNSCVLICRRISRARHPDSYVFPIPVFFLSRVPNGA